MSLSPGQRIKHWREIRGLKQNELADLAKIEQSKLCRIEGGKIQARAEDIEQIADALELSMGEFYGEVAEAS